MSERSRSLVAYCIECNAEGPSTYRIGTLLRCSKSPEHHARVVAGSAGKAWFRTECWLDRYAQRRSPRWRFACFHDNAGLYVGSKIAILAVGLFLVSVVD